MSGKIIVPSAAGGLPGDLLLDILLRLLVMALPPLRPGFHRRPRRPPPEPALRRLHRPQLRVLYPELQLLRGPRFPVAERGRRDQIARRIRRGREENCGWSMVRWLPSASRRAVCSRPETGAEPAGDERALVLR